MIRSYTDKISLLIYFFLILACIEIGAEYLQNQFVIWIVKPLLLPVLFGYYLLRTKKLCWFYSIALVMNWMANIAFIMEGQRAAQWALIFFIISRALIVYQIGKNEYERGSGRITILLGSAPFVILFLSVINLAIESIGMPDLYLIVLQSILMSLYGGIAFGSFFMLGDKASKMLFMSSLYFALNLFVLGVKMFYLDLLILKPLSMLFFIIGHFFLVKYMVVFDNEIKN